jgi:CubicO group peptidase (beta-lactamase class C family)
MTPRVAAGENRVGYGYHWYLSAPQPPVHWYGAFGNGGQSLTIAPGSAAVVAINGGRYNRADAWRLPLAVELEHVFPALRR